jgi:DNA-binding LacI/PurR family transcriptional regulator
MNKCNRLPSTGYIGLFGRVLMSVTIRSLAAKLELSTATVSRVLNSRQSSLVSQDTRRRVMQMAQELGYHPNPAAQVFATGRTDTIGLLTFAVYPCHYSESLNHLQRVLSRENMNLQIMDTMDLVPSQSQILKVSSWLVDGIIAFDSPNYVRSLLEVMPNPRVPVVCMGAAVFPEVDTVWLDVYDAVAEGIRHLAARGGRRLACLGFPEAQHSNDPRFAAYRDVMKQVGLPCEFIPVASEDFTKYREVTRTVIRDYVARHGCPEGIFASTDEVAIGVFRGLRDLNLRIPQDVAILGFDGIEDTAYHDPSISTISMPMEPACRKAWELLRSRMEDGNLPPRHINVKANLVIRESSS